MLEMRELRSFLVPSGRPLAGATVANDGRIALWLAGSDTILLADGPSARRIASYPPITALSVRFVSKSSIEAFDGVRETVVELDTIGRRIAERRYPLRMDPSAAQFIDDAWFVAGRQSSRSKAIKRLADSSTVQLSLPVWLRDDSEHEWHLSVGNEGLLVTQTTAPFQVTELDVHDGRVIAVFSPGTAIDSTAYGHWISMAAIGFGDGYLQTLSDPTSDRRIILVYDVQHRFLRSRSLTAPIGFVGANSSARLLVGGRWAKGPEYVVYTWSWKHSDKTF